jgi:hypothetical protein
MSDVQLAQAGHNNPPDTIALARDIYRDLAKFLSETPVIQDHDTAKTAGLWIERTRKMAGDIEDERTRLVKPLNEQVDTINERFHAVHNANPKKPGALDRLLIELRTRLTAFAQAEEDRRLAIAEAARRAAEAAEAAAREAEQLEAEVKEDASMGEIGAPIAAAVANADAKFAEFEKAHRAANRAANEIPVRVGSQLGGRALSLRTKETLTLVDAIKALAEIGITEKISDAILSGARDFRKLKGRLPEGVTSDITRTI